MDDEIARLRRDYRSGALDEAGAAAEPFGQFRRWFAEARAAAVDEPNAMTLATVDAGGAPRARVVLLKDLDDQGFVFFTNYDSDKGRELAREPRASLVFLWLPLERQVRVEGRVAMVDAAESDAYFASRPRESQLGAVASPQSAGVPDRAALERAFDQARARFEGAAVPRPSHWGGYRLVPTAVEFWQGRTGRLHDRLRYRRAGDAWARERLAP